MRRFALLSTILAVALLGCSQGDEARQGVSAAWVRLAAVKGNPSAAYFTLRGGDVDDRLMQVSSPLAIRAEMHDMSMSGAMMTMEAIKGGVAVPAGKAVSFAPGGRHVMLFDVSPKVEPGSKLPLTLIMASGAAIAVQADVIAAGADAPVAK